MAQADQAAAAKPMARLLLIRPDGSEGDSLLLRGDEAVIGRSSGPPLDGDGYLSPTHARFRPHGAEVVIEDLNSLNGIFVRITGDEPLSSGDVFRVGQELLRFDAIGEPLSNPDGTEILGSPNPGYWGRLSLIVGHEQDGSSFPLMGDEMVLGREVGDVLFSDDGYVSGTHAKIWLQNGHPFLSDVGSSNGTFLKIRTPRSVPFGSFVLMGQQLFRVERPS